MQGKKRGEKKDDGDKLSGVLSPLASFSFPCLFLSFCVLWARSLLAHSLTERRRSRSDLNQDQHPLDVRSKGESGWKAGGRRSFGSGGHFSFEGGTERGKYLFRA